MVSVRCVGSLSVWVEVQCPPSLQTLHKIHTQAQRNCVRPPMDPLCVRTFMCVHMRREFVCFRNVHRVRTDTNSNWVRDCYFVESTGLCTHRFIGIITEFNRRCMAITGKRWMRERCSEIRAGLAFGLGEAIAVCHKSWATRISVRGSRCANHEEIMLFYLFRVCSAK